LKLLAVFSAFVMIQGWFQDDGDLLKFLYEMLRYAMKNCVSGMLKEVSMFAQQFPCHLLSPHEYNLCTSGFGGLEVACWPLVPKFAGSNPAEAIGFLRAKKFSTRLPSEGK
jgi:hypothetical protein